MMAKDDRRCMVFFMLYSRFCLVIFLIVIGTSDAYQNYTVGDSLGWYDKTENSAVDYQKWAVNKTFSLGDYLLFNTNTNHSVMRTYNSTAYRSCDFEASDVYKFSTSMPSNTDVQATTVAVPLDKEGSTYFFSGYYDGEQCRNGQNFSINVSHGQGLPPDLQPPQSEPPGPAKGERGNLDDDSIPDTQIQGNFDALINDTAAAPIDDGSSPSSAFPLLPLTFFNFHSLFFPFCLYFIF